MQKITRFITSLTILVLASVVICTTSCKKQDYITGGTVSNPKVNQTTYDYLAGNSMHLFDTLLMLVDMTGLKDSINQPGITFFAPTDYSIDNYLTAKTLLAQTINPDVVYSFDTLVKYDLNKVKDSLMMYIIHQPLTYSELTNNGALYPTALAGDTVVVSYEYTKDPNLGYSPLISSVPQVMYFTQLWAHVDPPIIAATLPTNIAIHTLCQTSGLQTTTGMLNVLENGHTLFFYGTNQ